MEFVGKTVKKEFLGFGVFTGTVRSFDPSTRFFKIVYEDGDSEEMEFNDVSSIVVGETKEVAAIEMVQTKKRSRGEEQQEIHGTSAGTLIEETKVKDGISHGEFSESLKKKVLVLGENSIIGSANLNESVICVDDLNGNVLVHENLNKNALSEVNLRENGCFDVGLQKNNVIESTEELPQKENDFDMNLGYQEGTQSKGLKDDEGFKKIASVGVFEITQEKGSIDFDKSVIGDALSERDVGVGSEDDMDLGGESKRDASLVFETTQVKFNGIVECYPKSDDGRGLGSIDKEEPRSKKRRKASENMKATKEIVLRRSSRRINSTYSLHNVLKMEESSAVDTSPNTDEISPNTDDISVGLHPVGLREQNLLPPKLDLPPSSKYLNLDDIPIIDLFSVYSCLRSFSTVLFLSPFNLEAFVAALNNKFPNSLIDSIHFSILRTLKLQLEFLSVEGSQSASNCLRSLNWGLLDLITWPVYMVEYLLIHGTSLKPGFELSRLKLLNSDYYKQPPTVKLEILRCLCDDLLEAEVIRSELNRRNLASEFDMDFDHISNIEIHKKRKHPIDELGGSCLTQESVDETKDWNIDECCLCKMDGSLICCDGCPAAYHSRCVGIVKDLLPEGDWFCPECMMEKHDPSIKSSKSLRGADLLGIDPYGRLYFFSCGYLLVSEPRETELSYYYYHRDDLNVVIEVLKSSYILYSGIINAISVKWNIRVDLSAKGGLDSQSPNVHKDLVVEGEMKPSETYTITQVLDAQTCKVSSRSVRRSDSATAIQVMEMASPFASSEGSTEISQVGAGIKMSLKNETNCSNKSFEILNQIETVENNNFNAGDCSLQPTASNVDQKQNIEASVPASANMQFGHDCYVNYYSFARIAASIAGELTPKSSENINEDPKKSDEDIVALQMNLISKNVTRFSWPNVPKLHMDTEKESCGWCFFCKNPAGNEDCLFSMTEKKFSPEGSGIGSSHNKNKESHLTIVIHHILSIEERLSGLLSGPWRNPHYRKHWRTSVLKASNVASLRNLLSILESNLRRIALSADWLKVVDSVVTLGSASHAWTKGQVSSSKNGSARKRGKFSHSETNSTSNGAARSGIFWWRGGRVSRQVFHCKVLPRSLAVKSGRQAGCKKIPTVLYLDNSEFARRSRYIAWRAAVEMSSSVTQLACQVREFDMNIRWDDIENTQLLTRLDKEYKRLWRLFKKVTIRRKCVEGTNVKYLLDFGKRRTIPDSVIRHGVMLELSASERKKYWLDELHVPLNILKAFEEKKLARISNKTDLVLLNEEASKLMKKPSRKKGLSYLLSKSENYRCGQCHKDVPVREAVSCKDCKGFFHKKHFRKSKGTTTSEPTYTCHKCQKPKLVKKPLKIKKKVKKGKPLAQEKIVSVAGRPRRSIQRVNYVELQTKQLAGVKKHTQSQPKKGITKKNKPGRPRKWVSKKNEEVQPKIVITKKNKPGRPRKGITKKHEEGLPEKGISKRTFCWHKRKRTRVYHAFWLNGLRLTKKPDDARVMDFREGRLLLPSEHSNALRTQPFCGLCSEAGYTSTLVYIRCENCQEWFHGDAFGFNVENNDNIIGFRCHECRESSPPVCPHLADMTVPLDINEEKSSLGDDCVNKEVPDFDDFSSGKDKEHRFSAHGDDQGLFHTYVRKQRSDAVLNFNHEDQNACEVPDSNHSKLEENIILFPHQTLMVTECDGDFEKGLEFVEVEEKCSAVPHLIHEDQKADTVVTVLDSDNTPLTKACKEESGNEHINAVGSLSGAITPSCTPSEDVMETEVPMVEHNKVEEDFPIKTASPGLLSPVTIGFSTELMQPHSPSSLTEPLDTGGNQV